MPITYAHLHQPRHLSLSTEEWGKVSFYSTHEQGGGEGALIAIHPPCGDILAADILYN